VAFEVPTPSLLTYASASSAGSALPQANTKHDDKSARGSWLPVTPGQGGKLCATEFAPENRRTAAGGAVRGTVWASEGDSKGRCSSRRTEPLPRGSPQSFLQEIQEGSRLGDQRAAWGKDG